MPSDPGAALSDIAEHIILVKLWTASLTSEQFKEDRKTFYAVTRCLEIISEASRRLPDEITQRGPNVPWRRIRAAGNVYRHQYDDVLEHHVFNTVHDALSELKDFVEGELSRP